MRADQHAASPARSWLFVALCLAILVCIGWAVAAVVYYRRAMAAENEAVLAVKQARLAEEKMQQAEQRATIAEQALYRTTFQLAYVKNAVGVEWLAESELPVVRPIVLNDPVMQKLEEQMAADRARVKEYFDPDDLIRDDYHTVLNSACDLIKAYKKANTQLRDENSRLIESRDMEREKLRRALRE